MSLFRKFGKTSSNTVSKTTKLKDDLALCSRCGTKYGDGGATDRPRPFALHCTHAICENCLVATQDAGKKQSITCPVCRKVSKLEKENQANTLSENRSRTQQQVSLLNDVNRAGGGADDVAPSDTTTNMGYHPVGKEATITWIAGPTATTTTTSSDANLRQPEVKTNGGKTTTEPINKTDTGRVQITSSGITSINVGSGGCDNRRQQPQQLRHPDETSTTSQQPQRHQVTTVIATSGRTHASTAQDLSTMQASTPNIAATTSSLSTMMTTSTMCLSTISMSALPQKILSPPPSSVGHLKMAATDSKPTSTTIEVQNLCSRCRSEPAIVSLASSAQMSSQKLCPACLQLVEREKGVRCRGSGPPDDSATTDDIAVATTKSVDLRRRPADKATARLEQPPRAKTVIEVRDKSGRMAPTPPSSSSSQPMPEETDRTGCRRSLIECRITTAVGSSAVANIQKKNIEAFAAGQRNNKDGMTTSAVCTTTSRQSFTTINELPTSSMAAGNVIRFTRSGSVDESNATKGSNCIVSQLKKSADTGLQSFVVAPEQEVRQDSGIVVVASQKQQDSGKGTARRMRTESSATVETGSDTVESNSGTIVLSLADKTPLPTTVESTKSPGSTSGGTFSRGARKPLSNKKDNESQVDDQKSTRSTGGSNGGRRSGAGRVEVTAPEPEMSPTTENPPPFNPDFDCFDRDQTPASSAAAAASFGCGLFPFLIPFDQHGPVNGAVYPAGMTPLYAMLRNGMMHSSDMVGQFPQSGVIAGVTGMGGEIDATSAAATGGYVDPRVMLSRAGLLRGANQTATIASNDAASNGISQTCRWQTSNGIVVDGSAASNPGCLLQSGSTSAQQNDILQKSAYFSMLQQQNFFTPQLQQQQQQQLQRFHGQYPSDVVNADAAGFLLSSDLALVGAAATAARGRSGNDPMPYDDDAGAPPRYEEIVKNDLGSSFPLSSSSSSVRPVRKFGKYGEISTQPGAFRAPTRVSIAAPGGGLSDRVVVVDRQNQTVQVFRTATGECLSLVRVDGVAGCCLWTTDGQLAAATRQGTEIYDVNGVLVRRLAIGPVVSTVAVGGDGGAGAGARGFVAVQSKVLSIFRGPTMLLTRTITERLSPGERFALPFVDIFDVAVNSRQVRIVIVDGLVVLMSVCFCLF